MKSKKKPGLNDRTPICFSQFKPEAATLPYVSWLHSPNWPIVIKVLWNLRNSERTDELMNSEDHLFSLATPQLPLLIMKAEKGGNTRVTL